MLITTKEQVTVEGTREVSLPFFSKHLKCGIDNFYAIHEDVSFLVMLSDHVVNVSIVNDNGRIYEAIKYEPITEMDFDFAYQMAIDRLQRATTLPQQEKQAV